MKKIDQLVSLVLDQSFASNKNKNVMVPLCVSSLFQIVGNCNAELLASESCRRHIENHLGSKRALEGARGEAQKISGVFIMYIVIT